MISVCMATYNGERFIRDQIDSIIAQLNPEDELIISDNGSTDKTLKIIESYNDKRIFLINHVRDKSFLKEKSGTFKIVTQNFHNALQKAKGDYIFLADQDDIWYPTKVNKTLNYLLKYDICMSNFSVIDENNTIQKKIFYKKSPISNSLIKNIISSKFLGCCLAFNKKVLNKSLPFPTNLIAHDFWIGCIGSKKFKFVFIDEPLVMYRRWQSNVSATTSKSNNSFFYKIRYRLKFFSQLLNKLK